MTDQTQNQTKITMRMIHERNNRNRHYQIVKENRWVKTGRVFTGLGLYREIIECYHMDLVSQTEYEDRYDIKNWERNTKIMNAVAREILDCVAVGTDKTIALRYSTGEIQTTSGWEYDHFLKWLKQKNKISSMHRRKMNYFISE